MRQHQYHPQLTTMEVREWVVGWMDGQAAHVEGGVDDRESGNRTDHIPFKPQSISLINIARLGEGEGLRATRALSSAISMADLTPPLLTKVDRLRL